MPPKYLILLAHIRAGSCSFRDLDAAIGATPTFSNARVSWYLWRLRRWGLITWEPGKARTLRLTEAGERAACGLLLSRRGERVTGVWRVSEAATEKATTRLIDEMEFDRLAESD